MIYHLLYIFELSGDFNFSEVVAESKENYKKKDITGVLINNGNYYIQLLEGKKEIVELIFDKVKSDREHFRIKNLMNYQDSQRIFEDWNMGVVNTEKIDMTMEEIVPVISEGVIKAEGSRERMLLVMKNFNQKIEKKEPPSE